MFTVRSRFLHEEHDEYLTQECEKHHQNPLQRTKEHKEHKEHVHHVEQKKDREREEHQ